MQLAAGRCQLGLQSSKGSTGLGIQAAHTRRAADAGPWPGAQLEVIVRAPTQAFPIGRSLGPQATFMVDGIPQSACPRRTRKKPHGLSCLASEVVRHSFVTGRICLQTQRAYRHPLQWEEYRTFGGYNDTVMPAAVTVKLTNVNGLTQ